MNKLYIAGLAAFAVMAAYGVQAAETTTAMDSDDAGNLLLADHLIEGLGDNPSSCGATAPGTTKCYNNNGLEGDLPNGKAIPGHQRGHRALGSTSVSHGVALPMTGYTGTIESKLDHLQGMRVFRCNFSGGVFLGCMPGSGTFPGEGLPFAHVCQSYNLGTTQPGGSGNWNCRLTHASIL